MGCRVFAEQMYRRVYADKTTGADCPGSFTVLAGRMQFLQLQG